MASISPRSPFHDLPEQIENGLPSEGPSTHSWHASDYSDLYDGSLDGSASVERLAGGDASPSLASEEVVVIDPSTRRLLVLSSPPRRPFLSSSIRGPATSSSLLPLPPALSSPPRRPFLSSSLRGSTTSPSLPPLPPARHVCQVASTEVIDSFHEAMSILQSLKPVLRPTRAFRFRCFHNTHASVVVK